MDRTIFGFIWKHSKRDQLILLAVTLTLFPLLYLTLELPKRIINDAIAAPVPVIDVYGYQIPQIQFLFLLCGMFLLAVIGHGLMKMRINTMKGVLAERLLRRFRYSLIARILRFPAPYFERTSQGELVSMVTSESEPMGGLMGDAVAQPVLQAGQMLTILGFLFAQSWAFGLAACALIPLQAWLIPKLQRQINKLNKKRALQVRALAGEIGESAAGAATLRVSGGWPFRLAMITDRLGRLFAIRFEIYQKKFFMKFINNFITQLTPFFFYAFGGYLVILGQVSLGALVAALAAYKDLSSPWKELLAYYNQSQDMQLRWETITERFVPAGMIDDAQFQGRAPEDAALDGDIVLDGVTVRNPDGNAVLEDLDMHLGAGALIGIAAPAEEDRQALAALLTREVLPSAGTVAIGGTRLTALHQGTIAGRIGHATSRPVLFLGTVADNILLPLKSQPRGDAADAAFAAEAARAGNSHDMLTAPWVDYSRAGVTDDATMAGWGLQLIDTMGVGPALFRRALDQRLDGSAHPRLSEKLVALRPVLRQAIAQAGLAEHAIYFKWTKYNPALPVAENLLFATARQPITPDLIAGQTAFLEALRDLGLDQDLMALTRDVVDLLRQIFGLDGTDHPLFRKLSLDAQTFERAVDVIAAQRDGAALNAADTALLLTVPFLITAEQIGPGFPDGIMTRVLEMRHSHAQRLRETLGDLFAPIEDGTIVEGMTVLENAMFGKISDNAGSKGDELRSIVAGAMMEQGLDRHVLALVFEMPVAIGGQGLPTLFAEPMAIARAAVKRPDILILEDALASYDAAARETLYANLHEILPGTTIIVIAPSFEDTGAFAQVIEVQGGRIVGTTAAAGAGQDSAASADLARKVAALEATSLFSEVSRKQLRLLAFGARWYEAQDGAYVFHKNDPPDDGAYLIQEGEADLLLPEDGEDKLIATVGPGALVGELGLIRADARALDMRAKGDLRCLRLGTEEFLAVVENDASTAFKLLQVVAGYVNT
ncbi:MAG: ABC transporter transmembrane domain-containing protein [Pseudomonadota bacterium]